MSHQSKIACSVRQDRVGIAALREAVKEFSGCSLKENTEGRTYGSPVKADYVISTGKTASYDVLCYKQKDGSLRMTTDWYNGSVAKVLGTNLNKLMQSYKKHKSLAEARVQGCCVSQTVLPNGSIELLIGGIQ